LQCRSPAQRQQIAQWLTAIVFSHGLDALPTFALEFYTA
jgi:hypothetical protein